DAIEHRQTEIEAFHAECFPRREPVPAPVVGGSPALSDHDVLDRAFKARNGAKVRALYRGDDSMHGDDASAADLALVSSLAFYTQDPAQLERLFRGSPRMRGKWDEVHSADGRTYAQMTIDTALSSVTSRYGELRPVNSNGARPDNPEGVLGDSDGGKMSQATLLVRLALADGVGLFHTPAGDAYARVRMGDHHEVYATDSRQFRRYLERLYFDDTARSVHAQARVDAVGVLEARALFDGDEAEVYVRVAEVVGEDGGRCVYLDLGDAAWTAIEIDARGWRPAPAAPVRFRRPHGMGALPMPVGGGSLDELRPLLNLPAGADGDRAFKRIVGWLLAAVRGTGPYPVLFLSGEQGSAKSTAARMVRRVIDPNTVDLRSSPRDVRDLMIAARNAQVLAFDNVSGLPDWLSDALCSIATGGGYATRSLYSNDEEMLFGVQRPIIINGIDDVATRPDLLDRAIIEQLLRIPDDRRRPEEDVWRDFAAAHPRILGALLHAVVSSLANASAITLPKLPRMADFAKRVETAAPALGWEAGAFLKAYTESRERAHETALDAEPLTPYLRAIAAQGFDGTWAELLAAVNTRVPEALTRSRSWPKNGRAVSGVLRRIAPNLRAVGVEAELPREPHTRTRKVVLTTVSTVPTVPRKRP
ncbi:MAG: hypothetical protein O2894_14120, partial [Planctomycetota bacterium]|nr:hypothetical protein [Planctomycetota bacterium]